MKKAIRKLYLLVLYGAALILQNCGKTEPPSPDCPNYDNLQPAPYDDPIWHPSGDFIGFNHKPIKEIKYTYGYDCPRQASYIYEKDSTGFWLIDKDGTNKRRILSYKLETPAWSPDGEWIAFGAGGQIFKIPFDGIQFDTTSIEQLTFEGSNYFPAWNKSNKIAFNQSLCENDLICGIWIHDIITKINTPIMNHGNYPTWNPKSDSLLFSTRSILIDGNVDGDSIWLYSEKKYKKCFLTHIKLPNYRNRYFKYSPSGEKVAFISSYDNGEGTQLCTLTKQGSDLSKLTDSGAMSFSWSPDGKIVYLNYDYSRIDKNKGALWIMDEDGSNQKQLTFNNFITSK